jgi:hypothetical protein
MPVLQCRPVNHRLFCVVHLYRRHEFTHTRHIGMSDLFSQTINLILKAQHWHPDADCRPFI